MSLFKDLTLILIGVLAVCGAAFFGYLLGGLFAIISNRLVFHRKPHHTVVLICRWLGAFAAGLLAAWLVFGRGGGMGFGGGPGTGRSDTGTVTETPPPAPAEPEKVKAADPPPPPTPPVSVGTIQVTLLSPPFQGERCYRVEPDRTPKTLAEVQQVIESQKLRQGAVKLDKVELLVYRNSPYDRRLVLALTRWVTQAGLTAGEVRLDADVP